MLQLRWVGYHAGFGDPAAHHGENLWQSAAWIAGILIVFGALAVMEYRKA